MTTLPIAPLPLTLIARTLCLLLAFGVFSGTPTNVRAADLPLAAGSPLVGFNFEDRPLLLPVQRNFQMAMLTASSELGRSCGNMEAYGWRMAQSEQQRVDQVFSSTVGRLRGLGYSVKAEAPASVAKDITMFTADRTDRHFLFMWSAGELGLVMVICETSPPLVRTTPELPSVQVFPQDIVQSKLVATKTQKGNHHTDKPFTPVGDWVGSYTCAQGYTGATLSISQLKGENFEGTFRFYATPKNPYAPNGRYQVYGQYDRETGRVLVNPGKWLERPPGYDNTIMVGGFDAGNRSFSGYFQGISGCTSFEAQAAANAYPVNLSNSKPVKAHKPKKKAHKHVKPKAKDVSVEKAESKADTQTPDMKTSGSEAAAPATAAETLPVNATPPVPSATGAVKPTDTAVTDAPISTPAAVAPVVTPPPASVIAPPTAAAPSAVVPNAPVAATPVITTPPSAPAQPTVTPSSSTLAPAIPPATQTLPSDRHGSALTPVLPTAPTASVVVTAPVAATSAPATVTSPVASPASTLPAPPTPPEPPANIVLPSVGEPASKK